MPRFVILKHDHPELHWDFMLEADGVLKTWELSMPPEIGRTVKAESSFDHRLLYLDYEGPISNKRGSVVRWDTGSFTWKQNTEGHVQVDLQGEVCKGLVDLILEPDQQWILTLVCP